MTTLTKPLLDRTDIINLHKAIPVLFIQARDTAGCFYSHMNPAEGFAVATETVHIGFHSLDRLPRLPTRPGQLFVIHTPEKLVWVERVRFFREFQEAVDFAEAIEDTYIYDLATMTVVYDMNNGTTEQEESNE